jgi:uncharacterized protein
MLFVSVVFLLALGGHLMLYRFAVRWFEISHPALRAGMMILFVLLAASFIMAFFLLRWDENAWSIGFYKASAVWYALFIKLSLAAVAAWLMYGLLSAFGATAVGFRTLGAVCVAAALGWAAYGFWCAFHPVVTHVKLVLEDLPESWRGSTIVQLSDVHLGRFHTPRAMERLAARVNALSPDLVVITGDLFDGMIDGMPEFVPPLSRLTARRGVFFVTGNHEVYAGQRRCLDIVKQAGIRVLHNEVLDLDGVALMGIAYPGVADESAIRGLEGAEPDGPGRRPLILLFHTPSDIRRPAAPEGRRATYWRPDTSFALARRLGVSLQLSGHTHGGQFFPFGLMTNWIYNGYDYGLHRDGGFSIYVSSGVGTWGPPMRTGARGEIAVFTLR